MCVGQRESGGSATCRRGEIRLGGIVVAVAAGLAATVFVAFALRSDRPQSRDGMPDSDPRDVSPAGAPAAKSPDELRREQRLKEWLERKGHAPKGEPTAPAESARPPDPVGRPEPDPGRTPVVANQPGQGGVGSAPQDDPGGPGIRVVPPDQVDAPGLLRDLESPDAARRRDAAAAMVGVGPFAEKYVPELRKAVPLLARMLRDPDPDLRVRAAMALGVMTKVAQESVPALVELLDDPDASVRFQAGASLGCFARDAEAAVPALMARLTGADPERRKDAGFVLAAIGRPAVRPLAEAFRSPDPAVRDAAAGALAAMGPGEIERDQPETIAPLVHAIRIGDKEQRWKPAPVLAQFGPAAQEAVPVLIAFLHELVHPRKTEAFRTLEAICGDVDARLLEAVRGPDSPERLGAAVALLDAELGPEDALTVASAVLRAPWRDHRISALKRLGGLGPAAAPAAADLGTLLVESKDNQESAEAVRALDALGPAAVPGWSRCLASRRATLVEEALKRLAAAGAGAEPAVPSLVELVHEPQYAVRAADALAAVGEPGIAALTRGLADAAPERRMAVMFQVGRLAQTRPALIEFLRPLLRDPDGEVRLKTAYGLAGMEPAESLLPVLEEALQSKVDVDRCFAVLALGRLESHAEAVVPLLVGALSDRDYRVRRDAAQSLGRYGAAARAAIPALEERLKKDRQPEVRKAAEKALQKIR